MLKYWGKNYFAHGIFPKVGQKQKTEKTSTHGARKPPGPKEEEERERERLNNGENNGQATLGARKHAWCTQAALANISVGMILNTLVLITAYRKSTRLDIR